MEFWIAVSVMLLIYVVVPIWFAIHTWRNGMRSEFYFDTEFYFWPIVLACIAVMTGVLDVWLREKPFDLQIKAGIIGAVWVFHTVFYSLGFLHGMMRRRRREGVLS